jgi:hypothetical protein
MKRVLKVDPSNKDKLEDSEITVYGPRETTAKEINLTFLPLVSPPKCQFQKVIAD